MLLGYLTTPRADMNRPFIFLTSTLILMIAIAVVTAQDNGAALNNSASNITTLNATLNLTAPNSTSLNETTLSAAIQKAAYSNDSLNDTALADESTIESINKSMNKSIDESMNESMDGSVNKSIDEAAPRNASRNYAVLNTTAANQTALNLSTINNVTLDAVSITEIAKKAPEVAAGASSIQAPTKEEGALLIGKDGWDPLHDRHKSIEPSKIGLPIKPIRDTGKMFFVCDIV
jgi:hypothetical protein